MSLFENDPELLRAALEIIESWDCESSVNGVRITSSPLTEENDSANDEATSEDGSEDTRELSSTTSSPPPSTVRTTVSHANNPTPAPRELKPSTVASTRHKRREEIIHLRDRVKEMEAQLATLQKQKVDGDDSAPSAMNGVDAALAVMWQDIAGRQQRLRQKAELEQAKLRGLLETQMKVARGLIKLMQKARRIEEDETFPSAKRPKLPINVSVGKSEEHQCSHIEELYTQINQAFTFSKFQDGTLKFIDVEIIEQGDDEHVIEFRDAWALPFEIQEVMDAMWAYMAKRTEENGCENAESRSMVRISEDMFTTHFTASASVGALKGNFDGKGIYKKFPDSGVHGPAIISSMFAEPHATKGHMLEGIQMQDDGWLRVIPSQSLAEESNGRVLAVVQSNRRFRLTFDMEKSPASRRNAGVLTDFLLDMLTQEIQFKHETVETLLIHSRPQ